MATQSGKAQATTLPTRLPSLSLAGSGMRIGRRGISRLAVPVVEEENAWNCRRMTRGAGIWCGLRRMVALLQDHPAGLTSVEIRDLLGVGRSLADTYLGMLRYGLVQRVGRGKYVAAAPSRKER
jgi:hypothetical protein